MSNGENSPGDSRVTMGGAIPGGEGQAAFLLRQPAVPGIPVLVAVPHAGRDYPASLLSRMRP